MKQMYNTTNYVRHLSSVSNNSTDKSLLMDDKSLLIHALNSIYHEEWWFRGLSPAGKDRLIMNIVRGGEFIFEPIDLINTLDHESWCCYYMVEEEEERGLLSIEILYKRLNSDIADFVRVYSLGRSEDAYLMLGLSNVLLNRIHIGYEGPRELRKIRDLMEDHYEYINKLDRVGKLVKIQLDVSFVLHTRKTEILSYIDNVLEDGLVKDLIKQIVSLPIKGLDGKIRNELGISRVGELTRVILDLYYSQVFDPVLEATYPELRFSRWYNEVFIAIDMMDNKCKLDCFDIYMEIFNFLQKNQLSGMIQVSGHSNLGEPRFYCHKKERYVMLRKDGSVEVSGINDMNEWNDDV